MLIAIIIGLVLTSGAGTIWILQVKRMRVENLRSNIRSLSSMQVELLGRLRTFLGLHREEAVPPQGAIERRSRELSEQARELIAHAEARPGLNDNSMFLSLKASWTDIEENLSTAFSTYKRHVADYNSTLQIAPAGLLAKLLRYQKEPQLN
jgi:hypothetical protein